MRKILLSVAIFLFNTACQEENSSRALESVRPILRSPDRRLSPPRQSFEPEMLPIPAGTFRMGSENGHNDEKPVHSVTVLAFEIGKYEVTKGEFAAFVRNTNYQTEAEKGDGCSGWTGSRWEKQKKFNWRNVGFKQENNHPVVCISWNDAMAYVNWLSGQTGKQYRLPTEAEWEYVARSGTTTDRYWGDNLSLACNYANVADQTAKDKFSNWSIHNCRDGYIYTAPVGKFAANKFGLHDVLGNVWEWTCSWYGDSRANNNYEKCTGDGTYRVIRSGSWFGDAINVRAANRDSLVAGYRISNVGFRLAKTKNE